MSRTLTFALLALSFTVACDDVDSTVETESAATEETEEVATDTAATVDIPWDFEFFTAEEIELTLPGIDLDRPEDLELRIEGTNDCRGLIRDVFDHAEAGKVHAWRHCRRTGATYACDAADAMDHAAAHAWRAHQLANQGRWWRVGPELQGARQDASQAVIISYPHCPGSDDACTTLSVAGQTAARAYWAIECVRQR